MDSLSLCCEFGEGDCSCRCSKIDYCLCFGKGFKGFVGYGNFNCSIVYCNVDVLIDLVMVFVFYSFNKMCFIVFKYGFD